MEKNKLNKLNQLQELMNDPIKKAEILMPGYYTDIEKLIDQIIASAKTKFNYNALLESSKNYGLDQSADYADYLVRAMVIEFAVALDFESGLQNCEDRLREVHFPFNKEELSQFTRQLFPVLRKEMVAIRKINELIQKSTPIDLIIRKIRNQVEIKTDELGLL